MLHPSTRLPREQDSFIVHCPKISKKLLSYIISVDVKFTLNGKSFQKICSLNYSKETVRKKNVTESLNSFNIFCYLDKLTFFHLA